MSEHNLAIFSDWMLTEANSLEGGYVAMKRLLRPPLHPSAVLAADDTMAIGALKAILDTGLRIPQDVSIAGFDDIEMASYVSPTLTTVRQPIPDISQQALHLLIELLDGKSPKALPRITPTLIVRQSTGPAAQD
jgi:DNA-binding LacI/PurR family transcriptional regulator